MSYQITGSPISIGGLSLSAYMKRIISYCIALIVWLISDQARAQLDNSFFSWKHRHAETGTFRLHVENLNYFRNVEYKTVVDEGRTLLGFQFAPEVSYQISPRFLVSGGVYAKRDFGGADFEQFMPTFQLKYAHKKHAFIFGRLEGNMDHRLIEPALDPERIIFDRTENGFQYLLNDTLIDLDIWADWQKAIYMNSPYREVFDAGITGRLKPISKKRLEVDIPFVLLAHHKGGEIDTSGLQAVSQFTLYSGVELTYKPSAGALKAVRGGAYVLNYQDVSNRAETFIDGLGQYAFIDFRWDRFGVMANYWDSHQFESITGDVLYHSTSRQNPQKYILDYRKLWMLRLYYEQEITEDLGLLVRTNTIRDVNEETFEFIAEFYLRWTPEFDLSNGNR